MLQLYTIANAVTYPISVIDAFGKLVSIAGGASAKVTLPLSAFNDGDFVNKVAAGSLTLTPLDIGFYTVPNLSSSPVGITDSLGVPHVLSPQSITPVCLTSADSSSAAILSLKAQGVLGTLAAVTASTYPQSFLPVITLGGQVKGLYAIAPNTFAGTETTYDLSAGVDAAHQTVAVQKIVPGPDLPFLPRLGSYMGCVMTRAQEAIEDWKSQPNFIPLEDILPSNVWSQADVGPDYARYAAGVMVYSLCYGNNTAISVTTSVSPPTVTTPASMTWAVNAQFANQNGLRFVDFNWVSAFAASFPTQEPAYIQVTAQPAEGDVKAFVVSAGNQSANAGITQNTVRLVKIIQGAVAAGNREFDFNIVDRLGNIVPVVLNLSIS